jgi:hypothetical protein
MLNRAFIEKHTAGVPMEIDKFGSNEESDNVAKPNLPEIVKRVGGQLERVMTSIEDYTDENFPLTGPNKFAVSRIVEKRVELNEEGHVSHLVDFFSYHGINRYQRQPLVELIDMYSIDDVAMALEYLYETGLRDRGANSAEDDEGNSLMYVLAVLERIEELRDKGFDDVTVTTLDEYKWNIEENLTIDGYFDV